MFDRLEELVDKLDTINNQLTDPDVVSDQNKFRKLMKEQSDLSPIVEKYHEYKDAKTTIEDSLEILEEESDEELREMAKEEINEAKANLETIEQELKILLLPKDPNDSTFDCDAGAAAVVGFALNNDDAVLPLAAHILSSLQMGISC